MQNETIVNETEITQRAANRRNFLKGVGLASVGLAGSALLSTVTSPEANAATTNALTATDVAVLNFALNLEYLEAEFYTKAVYGLTLADVGIATDGVGMPGLTTGGNKVNLTGKRTYFEGSGAEFSGRLLEIATQITYDEQTHVKLLRSILGSQAIAKPEIDLNALGMGYANFKQFLSLARSFEDVGVSAYGGAAGLLSSATLPTGARIALTEAYHASNLRLLCAENTAVSLALDSLDNPPPPVGEKYFDVDVQGLAVVRTTSQVLAIVYANPATGTKQGGFFPQGVNGAITTV